MSTRNTMEGRVVPIEHELQTIHNEDSAKIAQLSSDLDVVTKRMGITAQDLQQAHALAEQLKQDNARTAQRLAKELATKADTKAVAEFQEDATNKLEEANNK